MHCHGPKQMDTSGYKAGYHRICMLPWKCPHTVQHFDTGCFITSSINMAHIKLPLEFIAITAAADSQFKLSGDWIWTNLAAPSSKAHEEAFLGTISNRSMTQHLLSARMNISMFICTPIVHQWTCSPGFQIIQHILKSWNYLKAL